MTGVLWVFVVVNVSHMTFVLCCLSIGRKCYREVGRAVGGASVLCIPVHVSTRQCYLARCLLYDCFIEMSTVGSFGRLFD